MSDTQGQSEEPDVKEDASTSDDISNDNDTGDKSADEIRLEKMYEKLPKLIARITYDNKNENLNALNALLSYFNSINELEKQLLGPDEEHVPLSLPRIYELAVSGGGDGNSEELEAANAAFAEENEILAETIESLTFQIETLKKQAADEILNLDDKQKPPLDELKTALKNINATMVKIQKQVTFLNEGTNEQASTGKSMDERFTEEFANLDDISSDLLKMSSGSPGFMGRMLRRIGLAYDHKDIAVTRKLVLATMKANRKLAELNVTIGPMQEQIDKLQHIVGLIELYAGHEERQGAQYQEAMEEIERLQTKLGRFEEAHGEFEEFEATLETKKEEFADQERVCTKLADQISELEEKAEELKAIKGYDELESESKLRGAKIKELSDQVRELKAEHKTKERAMKNAHRTEIAALNNRMRTIENGWLVEKLEAEIISLREEPEKLKEQLEKERETQKAFEERIEIWINDSEKAEAKAGRWKKIAGLKYTFMAAAATATAAAGFTAADIVHNANGMGWPYFAWSIGVTATVATVIGAIFSDNSWKGAVAGAALGITLGGMASGVGYLHTNGVRHDDIYDAFQKHCGDAPCQIVIDAEGTRSIVPLSEVYEGGSITLDYTNADHPVMTVQQPAAVGPAPQQ